MIARPRRRVALALAAAGTAFLGLSGAAGAATVAQNLSFETSDGVTLRATINGEAPLTARPTIVEFSPYGPNTRSFAPGPEFNSLLVQIRGTGSSDGRFDSLGPRTQRDVAEVLRWACHEPWSNGDLGLNGFSASAITIYNSLHLRLPCVRGAVLKSGTLELYRDLLYPGGISNLIPAVGVLGLIGGPALLQAAQHPESASDTLLGMLDAFLGAAGHPTLDSWWRERGFRGDVNDLPVLMVNGFFDVESRGAFQGYQALRRDGAHLMVIGAHDGAPSGTDGGSAEMQAWLDHFVAGVENGVERHPRVSLWLADGDREDLLAGEFVRRRGGDWPLPRTRWARLALAPGASSGGGSLGFSMPAQASQISYPSVPSIPFNTDPFNTAILGQATNPLAAAFPFLTEMNLAETFGVSFTTEPLRSHVLAAGPLNLRLRLSSTAGETGIWAVVSDVWPDGSAHPMTAGRLLSSYPGVDPRRSLRARRGGPIVQPYGRFAPRDQPDAGEERSYQVELWPVGNRFKAGHRIRLDLVGASLASAPSLPGLNTVTLGGKDGARLMFPVLPGSNLRSALGAPR